MDNNLKSSSEEKNTGAPQEHLSATLVADFFDRNFNKLNTNHDKFLSKEEIALALYKHTLSERDTRIAEAIIPNIHGIEKLSNDEWGTENNGITQKDITAFARDLHRDKTNPLAKAIEESLNSDLHNKTKFIEIVDIYKNRMDGDKSKGIGLAELNEYVKSGKDGARATEAAKILAEHFEALNNLGSKNSTGSFRKILPIDSNLDALTDKDLSNLKDVLGSEEQFRAKLWEVHKANQSSGGEVGKLGRQMQGPGDSVAGAVFGMLVEGIGSAMAEDSHCIDNLIKDYQQRKVMIDSWKQFKD